MKWKREESATEVEMKEFLMIAKLLTMVSLSVSLRILLFGLMG